MSAEQKTQSELLAEQVASQFRETGRLAKAFSRDGVLDIVHAAARDFAPTADLRLNLEILYPKASLTGEVVLVDPDVTIRIGSLVYTNDTGPTTRLKLAEPAKINDEIREQNQIKVGAYNILKALILGMLNDPQKLLAMGFQRLLDETKTSMKVTSIATAIQPNNAIGVIVT